jgi:hypothetical protein
MIHTMLDSIDSIFINVDDPILVVNCHNSITILIVTKRFFY